jgi:hypothetical protein
VEVREGLADQRDQSTTGCGGSWRGDRRHGASI